MSVGQNLNIGRGGDTLLHLIFRSAAGLVVINDRINGSWRSEFSFPIDVAPGGDLKVGLQITADGLRVIVPGRDAILIQNRFQLAGQAEMRVPSGIAVTDGLDLTAEDVATDAEPASPSTPPPAAAPVQASGPEPAAVTPPPSAAATREAPADIAPPVAEPVVELPAAVPQAIAAPAPEPAPIPLEGVVDDYGYSDVQEAMFFIGWMRSSLPKDHSGQIEVIVQLGDQRLEGRASLAQYDRADVREFGHGFVLLLQFPEQAPRAEFQFTNVTLRLAADTLWNIGNSPGTALRDGSMILRLAREAIRNADGGAIATLRATLNRPMAADQDTLGSLGLPVHLEFDEVLQTATGCAMLLGWCVDPMGLIASTHLRCGARYSAPLENTRLPVRRDDIQQVYSARYGAVGRDSGFMAWGDTGAVRQAPLFLEIRLKSGVVASKPLPLPIRSGVSAMRRILASTTLPGNDLDRVFDTILGKGLHQLNRTRLARPMAVQEERFGTLPDAPRVSLVIPLYKRLDFMRYQLAMFSREGLPADEVIYVLDDPDQRTVLLDMAHAAHASFGMPFRVLLPAENRGFGPASNLGLEHARGTHVLFLNSDVFPERGDWLDRLVARLDSEPGLGMVGPLLLFADGSVQHSGMSFEKLRQFSGWLFPMHPGKGRHPPANGPDLVKAPAITGAAMLMRRDLALELGGFDPDYVIGDFEDADLCLRMAARGLSCATDMTVRAWHLERQSQNDASDNWRTNLTLLNAWHFNRRRFPTRHLTAEG
ncbi:glycosyltransferase [Falsiroseomonas sp.]|uniref:glycosyltransferase n=1 Tax=Falsiroseomonas sp. TaxID=2870721 RepID=UPI0027205C92|nr:glycosyltransferase [Falsiroseomonas sp.]MDO9501207.1 glycosyltransferase [Falsiroseomonas sp.]